MRELLDLWWDKEQDVAHQDLFQLVKMLDANETDRKDTNLRCARLYGNSLLSSLTPQGYCVKTISSISNKKRMSLNIIANMTDTVTSKMSKIKPKVAFLTENGDAMLQQKAKKLQKFNEGQFYLHDFYSKLNDLVRDALVFDMGVLKICADGDQTIVERVLPDEIKVEPEDAVYGDPTHIYQVKYYSKRVLAAKFPEHKDKIMSALGNFNDYSIQTAYSAESERVVVVEGWHLPSSPDAGDGKHIIGISNETLVFEDYEKDHFPFIFLKWSDRLIGFHGQSLADRLTEIQFEINKILRDIQTSMNLFAIPFISVEIGSRINRSQLNNTIAHIVEYSDKAPRFETPPVMSQQVFDHLERLIRQAYEIAGVSQLSATSRNPSGLDAAVALREYQDIESERFLTFGQRVEGMALEAAELLIEAAKDAYGQNKSLSVNVKGKDFIEKIKWSEVDLDDDAYMLKLYPASILPEQPAGRLQFVMEMLNMGAIPKELGLAMLDYPDIASYVELLTAPTEDIQFVISKILEEGIMNPPEPSQNLQLGLQMVNGAYLKAKNNNVSEEKLEMLRQWLEMANEILKPPAPPAPPVSMAPPIPGQPGVPPPAGVLPPELQAAMATAPVAPPTAGV
jgi:hypothetical protein